MLKIISIISEIILKRLNKSSDFRDTEFNIIYVIGVIVLLSIFSLVLVMAYKSIDLAVVLNETERRLDVCHEDIVYYIDSKHILEDEATLLQCKLDYYINGMVVPHGVCSPRFNPQIITVDSILKENY